MKTELHKAKTRGHANHGWLDTWHTFSFANYHDPSRMHFGVLRVLNDDTIAPGKGFGMHSHHNMEIITIPLQGAVEHQDNLGNKAVISHGEVQVMSAGSGISHSEKNASNEAPLRLLQIWLMPNKVNVPPGYQQKNIDDTVTNQLVTMVSPHGSSDEALHIHQDAWFSIGHLSAGTALHYYLKKKDNGVYLFLIEGDLTVNNIVLNHRDGLGISEADVIDIQSNSDAHLLLMDVPLIHANPSG